MPVPGPPRLKTQPLVGINDIPGNTGFIKVSWLPPLYDGGSPLTYYYYELRDTGGGLASGGLSPEQTEATFNGFPNGYQFIFYLSATNAGYGGPYGPVVQTQPWQVGDPPTLAPATIVFSPESISTGTITWTPPSVLPVADIRWYVARLSPYWDQQYYQQQKGRAATNTNEIYMSSIGVQQISILGIQAVNCPGYSPARQLTYFPGQGSALFNGTVNMNLTPGILFSSNSFTIQLWVKFNTTPSSSPLLAGIGKEGGPWLELIVDSPTQIKVQNGSGIYSYSIGSALTTGTWYSIVVVRDATTNDETLWVNGVRSTTGVLTDSNLYSIETTYIGATQATYLDGYLTNIRIVNGTALFSPSGDATIPVPTEQYTPISGTELLLLECNSDCLSFDFVNSQGISTGATWSSDSPF